MRTLLLLLAVAASGCDVSGRVESEIEAALPKALGPAETYDATVDGVRLSGSAERVQIVGRRVAREDAPVIDQLDVDLHGVVVDRSARTLTSVDSARATARLLDLDLSAYLSTLNGVSDATITLYAPDRATVRMRGEIQGFSIPGMLDVSGRLFTTDGTVHIDVERVAAAGLSLGSRIARAISDRINPVIDLSDEDLALEVTAIRVGGGALVLEATGDLTGLRLSR